MLIENRPALDPELCALVVAQQREVSAASGGRDTVTYPPHDDVAYLVAVLSGRAVGCGAWQALEPGVAEIKRMYVRPAYRRRGIARQLLVALEEEILATGRRTVRLETGTYLASAIGLYTAAGYRPIPAYGEYAGNPYSVCFEQHLPVAVP